MHNDSLEARLAALESQNRRLKRTGLAALLGLGTLTLMSLAAPAVCDIIYAERFVMRDGGNKTRITMNAYGTDTPSIDFHDNRGRKMASIGLTPEGSFAFSVMDEGRQVPAAFSFDDKGALRLAKATLAKRSISAKDTKEKGVH